jgi:hypothetical protein
MARTTSNAVKSILLEDYDSEAEPSLTPFIDTANALTSRLATKAAASGEILTTAELELVERWLAAHFYVVSDSKYAENTTADAEAVYQGKTEMGLEASTYGQQALALDWTGVLVALSRHHRAHGMWLGSTVREASDYDTRNY